MACQPMLRSSSFLLHYVSQDKSQGTHFSIANKLTGKMVGVRRFELRITKKWQSTPQMQQQYNDSCSTHVPVASKYCGKPRVGQGN